LFPLPVAQLKEIIAKYQMLTITWAQEEQKNMGAYSFMLMNFNLVKWRLASLKHSASASGSSTRAKRRMADAYEWF
jgi:2-oxoglutarate dehydrogenase E1 component